MLLKKMSNEELISLCRADDRDALTELINRFAPLIRKRAESFSGTVHDDLEQEGFLALLDAVRNYSSERGASFSTYAQLCIRNRMINVFKRSDNDYDELPEEFDLVDEASLNPEDYLIEQERLVELNCKIFNSLSELEQRVFRLYVTGVSYQQIASELQVSDKVVDNAVQRMRKKLRQTLK
ncbi:MAG: sigma-70 family RNA polymerase sigma factor [Ruminococcus sp.]|nr:sigma-70 family RNA polymerase sigma factor [Ruminococcus sp.]